MSDRKIRWIMREKMKEIMSKKEIGLLEKVRGYRIREIRSK